MSSPSTSVFGLFYVRAAPIQCEPKDKLAIVPVSGSFNGENHGYDNQQEHHGRAPRRPVP